jgi:hypothetical protein
MKKINAVLPIFGLMVGLLVGVYIADPSLLTGKPKPTSAESYLFTSFDNASGEYGIIKTDNYSHIKTKYLAECDSFQLGTNAPVFGKDNCNIVVGRLLIPNRWTSSKYDFVDVFYMNDALYIIQGFKDEKVTQTYKIKSATVM